MTRRLLLCLAVASLWPIAASAQPQPASPADALFDDSTLHELWVHINARDWADLRATYLENTWYPCDVEWRGLKVRNAGCRSRGFGSRSPVKPGLLLQFDHYVTGQTWLGLRSLVLDNLVQDPSMMKERMSMRLLDRMGVPAPRVAHARLHIGSGRDYAGLYTMVENIDEPFLARQFGTDAGYLYEYRWQGDYHFEDLGADFDPYAVRFEPRTRRDEAAATLYAPIRDLVRAIADAPAESIEAAVAPYLDLRAFVRQAAVENYLAEWDGLLGYAGLDNFYLYKPAAGAPGTVIPWDKDNTFAWLEMPPLHNLGTNPLMVKAWQVPALRRLYVDTLVEAAAAADILPAEVQRAWAQVAEAAAADPVKPVGTADVEAAVQDLLHFVNARGAIVRRLAQDATGTELPQASR